MLKKLEPHLWPGLELMDLLIILIIAMAVLILFFLLYILISHFSNWRRNNFYNKKREEWEEVLYSYISGEITTSRAVGLLTGNYLVLWNFLKPYLTDLKGEEREKIIILARASGLTSYFFKKLKKGKKKEMITAASALGKLEERKVITHLKRMLFSNDTVEMTFAAKAIADLGETSYLILVFRKLLNDTYTTYEGISEIAVRFGQGICLPIKNLVQEWLDGERDLAETFQVPEEQVLSLMVDILGYYRYFDAAPQLENALQQTDNNEVIIHIFKALAQLEYPVSIALTPFLSHPDWIIRSQAVKYIGKMQDRTYNEEVKELLKEDNWWVRYYAAQALYLIGEAPYLQQLSSLEDNRAEMSQYILYQYRAS